MQFLKTLFWILIAGLALALAFHNWFPVSLRLWGGLIADVNLPLLLLLAYLLGLLPMLLVHHATRWRLRQRITGLERTIADLRAVGTEAPPPAGPAAQKATSTMPPPHTSPPEAI